MGEFFIGLQRPARARNSLIIAIRMTNLDSLSARKASHRRLIRRSPKYPLQHNQKSDILDITCFRLAPSVSQTQRQPC